MNPFRTGTPHWEAWEVVKVDQRMKASVDDDLLEELIERVLSKRVIRVAIERAHAYGTEGLLSELDHVITTLEDVKKQTKQSLKFVGGAKDALMGGGW